MPYRIGAAEFDITPTWRTMLTGFEHRTKPTDGVYQPIYVKCLALDDGRNSVVYLDAETTYWDSGDRSWGIIDAIRKAVRQKHGIEPDRLIMMATHNHSSPVLGDERFRQYLVEKSIEARRPALAAGARRACFRPRLLEHWRQPPRTDMDATTPGRSTPTAGTTRRSSS